MPCSLSLKIALPLFLFAVHPCVAQRKLTPDDSTLFYRKAAFLQEASIIITDEAKEEHWTKIENFTQNWKASETSSDELIFSINTLVAIEKNDFDVKNFPCDYSSFLQDYAKELKNVEENSVTFRYNIKLTRRYWYDATNDVRKLLRVIQSWSTYLIATHELTNTELFLCQVFSGKIADPRTAFLASKSLYPDLTAYEHSVVLNNDAFFVFQRTRNVGTAAVMIGSWLPTGNLQTLGIHPSVGVSLGVRNKMNEYDIVWNFRFLHPTPSTYKVLRNDTVYSSNYYDGGYIGLDYTRYVIHKTRYELGLVAAVGYDYFSVASGFNSPSDASPKTPLNVGSFDFNSGVRLKYFLGPRTYIGLVAKYHLVNYCNPGGTDLGGKAFTLDLVFGSH